MPVAREFPGLGDASLAVRRAERPDDVGRLGDRVPSEVEAGEGPVVEDEAAAVASGFGPGREEGDGARDKVGGDGGMDEEVEGVVVVSCVEGMEGTDGEAEREREQEDRLGVVVSALQGLHLLLPLGAGECEVVQAAPSDERRWLVGLGAAVEQLNEGVEVDLARGRPLHGLRAFPECAVECECEQVIDCEGAVWLQRAGGGDLVRFEARRGRQPRRKPGCPRRSWPADEHKGLCARLHCLLSGVRSSCRACERAVEASPRFAQFSPAPSFARQPESSPSLRLGRPRCAQSRLQNARCSDWRTRSRPQGRSWPRPRPAWPRCRRRGCRSETARLCRRRRRRPHGRGSLARGPAPARTAAPSVQRIRPQAR